MYVVVLMHNGKLYWVIGPFMTRDGAGKEAEPYRKLPWLVTVRDLRVASTPTVAPPVDEETLARYAKILNG